MANKILVARGTKARIEEIKGTLAVNELVYSTDTGELGVKKANGNIEYFKNATDIDAIEGEVIQLQTDIADKVDKVTGKGLSTNDYTNAEKTKLAGIEQGAEKNTVDSVNGKTGIVVINKSDVGLSNVEDTSDLDKPISTATQSALNLKADKTELNDYVTTTTFDMQMLEKLGIKPNGTDLLIIGGKINPLYIDDTSYKVNHPTVNSQAEMLALDVPVGTVVVRLDTPSKELFLLTQLPASTLANWQLVSSNTVVSVAGKTGAVVLGITDISGLTSALNLKLDITTFESQITQLQTDIATKVDKVSGKGLSTNDYTTTEKNKLASIESGAQVNPYSKTELDNKFNAKANDDEVVKITGDQTINGNKSFNRPVVIKFSESSVPGVQVEGTRASARYTNIGATGGVAAAVLDGRIRNTSGNESRVMNIGMYGGANLGGNPTSTYMYLDSMTDGAWNNTTLKVDSQNRLGIAIPSSGRPTQALDVNGKIRMRTATTSGDADDIVTTKGYVDTEISTISLTPGPKGDKGDKGDTGPKGDKGDTGAAATVTVGTTTTSAPGGNASVTQTGTAQNRTFNFVIPRGTQGPKGDDGAPGQAATLSVGTTTTSASGGNASVTQRGTAQARIFDFVIPRGEKGEKGEKGTASLNSIDVRGDNTPGSQWDLIPADMTNRSITSYFSQFPASDGMGTSWKSLLNIKGWSGSTYASWQLIGPASTSGTDEGLFYRTGNSTSGWSTPRKIFHSGNLAAGDIPNLPASKINSGTFSTSRIPDLSTSKITSGTFSTDRIPNLPTSKITSGRLSKSRLPSDTVYTADLATVATTGSYNDLSNKPTIPSIPSIMTTTEGSAGTATTQRTINAKNLKDIILNHSPAGSRPASDVSAWAKKTSLAIGDIPTGTTASTVALGNHTHSAATTSAAGFMSSADKTKLNGIETGAQVNPYSKTQLDNKFNSKANDNEVVKITGAQTISGVKTFNSPTTFGYNTGHMLEFKSSQNQVYMRTSSGKLMLKNDGMSSYSPIATESWVTSNIPTIPSIMTTTEGQSGTATVRRTITAANLKSIILHHSPAGARPASDVKSWAKANTLEEALKNLPNI